MPSFLANKSEDSLVNWLKGVVGMIGTVFRGIGLREAMAVVGKQKYERGERRNFLNGMAAKAAFGPGVYLVQNVEAAAHYALCHAESEEDGAAVLCQQLHLANPLILDHEYGETHLRQDALEWKYSAEEVSQLVSGVSLLELVERTGNVIREYALDRQYDGIAYYVGDDVIYYIAYFPDKQIQHIQIDFTFDIHDLRNQTVHMIRNQYKEKHRCT